MPTSDQLHELRDRLEHIRDNGGQFIVTTSGSTGNPKRVALTWKSMAGAARASADVIGTGSWLLAVPTEYIAGVMVVVRAMIAGSDIATIPHHREGFAAAARALPQPRYTALVPAQLLDLLDSPEDTEALATFEAVLVGGQRLDAQLRRRAEEAGVRVVATFGSTETCGGCVYDGVALPGVGLRVDDDDRLLISSPSLADGYLDSAGRLDVDRTGRAFVDRDGQRWYRTDDRAQLSEHDGVTHLRVIGRVDDVMITGGVKLDLAEVQSALDARFGPARSIVMALRHERWGQQLGVYVFDSVPADDVAGLDEWLLGRFGRHAKAVVKIGPAVLTPNGKPDRLAALGSMGSP